MWWPSKASGCCARTSCWKETVTFQTAMPLLYLLLDGSGSCLFRADKLPLEAVISSIWKHHTNYLSAVSFSNRFIRRKSKFFSCTAFSFDNTPFAIVGWFKQRISESRKIFAYSLYLTEARQQKQPKALNRVDQNMEKLFVVSHCCIPTTSMLKTPENYSLAFGYLPGISEHGMWWFLSLVDF